MGLHFGILMSQTLVGKSLAQTTCLEALESFLIHIPTGELGFLNRLMKHAFPYIMLMLGNGRDPYDHDTDGHLQDSGGCHYEFRNLKTPVTAKLTYIKGVTIKVYLLINKGILVI
jgi:hypothetical protein